MKIVLGVNTQLRQSFGSFKDFLKQRFSHRICTNRRTDKFIEKFAFDKIKTDAHAYD